MSHINFLLTFLKDRKVASLFPSSRFVLKKVLKLIHPSKIQYAVEFGPGTGLLVKRLLPLLHENSRLIAIERNDNFYQKLKHIHDKKFILIKGDALDFEAHLESLNIDKVDLVLSSISLSMLQKGEKNKLLRMIKNRLSENGRLIIYSQWSRHAKPFLKEHFSHVKTYIEPRNIPPAFIFEAKK